MNSENDTLARAGLGEDVFGVEAVPEKAGRVGLDAEVSGGGAVFTARGSGKQKSGAARAAAARAKWLW